jgi:hypothetical protein
MSTQSEYVLHLLALKRAETKLNLERQGYQVATDVEIEDQHADLVVKKLGETVLYEFKVSPDLRKDSEQIRRLQSLAAKNGYSFKLVVVSPPKQRSIEVEGLESTLTSYLLNAPIPDDLDTLASAVFIEDVVDLDIAEIDLRKDAIEIAGDATIEVRLEYGGGEERDGVTSHDSFPFKFRATLNLDLEIQSLDELQIDTSSFYE